MIGREFHLDVKPNQIDIPRYIKDIPSRFVFRSGDYKVIKGGSDDVFDVISLGWERREGENILPFGSVTEHNTCQPLARTQV